MMYQTIPLPYPFAKVDVSDALRRGDFRQSACRIADVTVDLSLSRNGHDLVNLWAQEKALFKADRYGRIAHPHFRNTVDLYGEAIYAARYSGSGLGEAFALFFQAMLNDRVGFGPIVPLLEGALLSVELDIRECDRLIARYCIPPEVSIKVTEQIATFQSLTVHNLGQFKLREQVSQAAALDQNEPERFE